MVEVIRLLLAGYGIAAAFSTGMFLLGASPAVALALAWIGGALATLFLASVAAGRWAHDIEADSKKDEDDALAEALHL